MKLILEMVGMLEYILFRRWIFDLDCNRSKINERVRRLMEVA